MVHKQIIAAKIVKYTVLIFFFNSVFASDLLGCDLGV